MPPSKTNKKKPKKIKGILLGFFETGTEGTLWAIQDERFIDQNGMYDMAGLNILKDGDHLSIEAPGGGEPIWSGQLSLLGLHRAAGHAYLKQYIVAYPMNKGYRQLNLAGRWVHSLPANVDLGLWALVFLGGKECRGELIRGGV